MIKNFTLATLALLCTISVSAQQVIHEKCATMHSFEHRMSINPQLQSRWNNYVQQRNTRGTGDADTTGSLIIPVVFHVLYDPADSTAEYIHDSLIISQLKVMNEDFGRYNADASNTLSVFDTIAVNTGIQFCLATQDPQGNPTTGITRKASTTSFFLAPFNNNVKADASGGTDPWDTDKYLNIWVCDMSFNGNPLVLGYAQFPGDDPATDGVVLQYEYVGRTNYSQTYPNNLGRTAVHEVGHWCGMRHIWGDGNCTMDDGIWDTPDADDQSQFDCQTLNNSCTDTDNPFWGNSNPVDMVQNYMDYSSDSCMNLYTRGQAARMWHRIVEERFGLFSSNGCGTPAINGYAVTKNISCSGACDATSTVTVVSGTAPFQYLWNDPMAQDSATATGLCQGNYTVRVVDADLDTMFIDVHVRKPDQLFFSTVVVDAPCSTCSTGSITVTATGGTQAYTYAIDNGVPQSSNYFGSLLPGTHEVNVFDSCGNMSTQFIIVNNTNGINELDDENLVVAPNPANDKVSIISNTSNMIHQIGIYNAVGQFVKMNMYCGLTSQTEMDVTDLAPGVYVISIRTQNGIATKKLVIGRD